MFDKKLKGLLDDAQKTITKLKKENAALNERIDKIVSASQSKLDKLEYDRKYYPGQVFSQGDNGILSDHENIREIAEIAQNPRFQFVLYDFREMWLAGRDRDSKEFIGGLEAIDQLKCKLLSYSIAYSVLAEAREAQ